MRIPHLRWYIALLLFTSSVINYVDRQTLSIVAPVLTKELQLSETGYANILQAFLIAYTVMYLVSGWITDRWGTRLALASFMSWWSAANALHALAKSAFQLGFFRFLLGAGESGNFMAASKAASEWYPPKERAFVNGLVNAGASVGAIIAAPLVVWLTMRFGWRNAFIITGSMGFVWLAAWLFFYHLPEKHPRITQEELAVVRGSVAGSPSLAARVKWIELLQWPQTWGLLLSRFVSDPVWWFYLFWLPKYLVEHRGFTMAEMGMLAWLPYLSADLGAVAGGLVSGHLVKKHWPVLRARKASMLPCAAVMPVSLIIAFSPSNVLVMALICLVTFSHMAWKTNLMTMTNDIYPTRMVGSVAGVVAFGSGLGGALFTNIAGRIISVGSYKLVFIIMGFLHPAALLIVQLLVRGELQAKARRPADLEVEARQ